MLGQKEIHNRKHSISIAFPVNVAEVTFTKQAVLLSCGCMNIGMIFKGHEMGWDEANTLETETNSRHRKYKELAHMACLTNPISQHSLDSSLI
jgi:hypothetical protein